MEKQINRIFKEFQKDLENDDYSILGSCQYKVIENTHDWALKLLNLIGNHQFEILIGITYKGILSLSELEHSAYLILENSYSVHSPAYGGSEQGKNKNPYAITEMPRYQHLINHETKRIPLENYASITKDEAWDLWSAYIGPLNQLGFPNPFKFTEHENTLNLALEEDDNFEIGIQLAYLTYLYGTDLSIWADYDT